MDHKISGKQWASKHPLRSLKEHGKATIVTNVGYLEALLPYYCAVQDADYVLPAAPGQKVKQLRAEHQRYQAWVERQGTGYHLRLAAEQICRQELIQPQRLAATDPVKAFYETKSAQKSPEGSEVGSYFKSGKLEHSQVANAAMKSPVPQQQQQQQPVLTDKDEAEATAFI